MKKQKTTNKTITSREELEKVLKVIPIQNNEQRNKIICALIGHSRICEICFGYRYCGRCSVQLGDSLSSIDLHAREAVIIEHNCSICRINYKRMTWKDKLYVPYPFSKSKKTK